MPYGGVYSKISTAARAEPKNTKLEALETTSFQGTTLRGLLLEAYGFSKIGTIMLYGAIASFILALMMLGFVVLGFRHAQRTPIEEEAAAPQARARAGPDGSALVDGLTTPESRLNGRLPHRDWRST